MGEEKSSALSRMLRAFNSRNYRLFFIGQLISLSGTWLTQVAGGWLVYRLTHSTVTLGVLGFASQIPAFFVAPFAGVLIDRLDKHRVIVGTQIAAMLQSLMLAVLTLTGAINIPWMIVLYLLQGLINAVDIPARQAFVVQMVERREDLPNAIALNSSMFNLARLIGPAIAGVLIAVVGEGVCFAIDAASYLAVIASLLMMRMPAPGPVRVGKHPLEDLMQGIRYVHGFQPLRTLLAMLALVTLAATPYSVLMPAFTHEVLGSGPKTLGLLMSSAGIGALTGGLYLASRASIIGLGGIVGRSSAGLGIALLGLSMAQRTPLAVLTLFLIGFFMITALAASNTLIQTITDDEKRGRVMSFYTMCFQGSMPLASLIGGIMAADRNIGIEGTLLGGGLCCLCASLLFRKELPKFRAALRPLYVERGIMSGKAP